MARPLRSLRQIPPAPPCAGSHEVALPPYGRSCHLIASSAAHAAPPKGASLIIPNRQLSGRASGNADNYFLIIASDNNNYRHCLRAALGSHLRSVSPLPHPCAGGHEVALPPYGRSCHLIASSAARAAPQGGIPKITE